MASRSGLRVLIHLTELPLSGAGCPPSRGWGPARPRRGSKLMTLRPRSSRMSWAIQVLGVAILYYGAARLGLLLAFEKTNASPVWPPSGIAFAAVLLLGYRVWPGIMLGAFLANVAVFLTNQAADVFAIVAVSSVIGVGNTLEASVGRALLDRLIGPFTRAQDVFTFTVVTLVACLVSPSIGPAAIAG